MHQVIWQDLRCSLLIMNWRDLRCSLLQKATDPSAPFCNSRVWRSISYAEMQGFTRWLASWLAGYLAGWLAGWLADWLAGKPAGWLAGRPAGWLAGWLAGRLAGWLVAAGWPGRRKEEGFPSTSHTLERRGARQICCVIQF